jgi:hypothetical protein
MDHSTPVCLNHCGARLKTTRFFVKALISTLFLVFAIQFNSSAQAAHVSHPACNISGPLEAVASGPDIVINVEVAHSTATPKITYEFTSNSSGASIRRKGAVVYDAAKNTATQQVTINPGTKGSEFNLKLKVVTVNGTSECSKSVSVSQ